MRLKLTLVLLFCSIGVNAVQHMNAQEATQRHAERIKYFYSYAYKADWVRDRKTGRVLMRLYTPFGPQIHDLGQVCPKELKT